MADQRPVLTKPQHMQSQSPLLSLPAELRVKILRYLLGCENGLVRSFSEITYNKHGYTIPFEEAPRGSPESMATYQEQVGGAQLLRTCQKLYWDGSNVLYKEQTAGIHVEYEGGRLNIGVLCRTIRLGHLEDEYEYEDEEPGWSYWEIDHVVQAVPELKPGELQLISDDLRLAAHRFPKFKLTIHPETISCLEVTLICPVLQGLLEANDVEIEFVGRA